MNLNRCLFKFFVLFSWKKRFLWKRNLPVITNLTMKSAVKKYSRLWAVLNCLLLVMVLSISCKNQTPKEPVSPEEDPLSAIEAMVNETKALAKEEAARVDEKTQKALESLRSVKFDPETVGEKLYQAILAGKDLKMEVFLFKTLNFVPAQADVLPAMKSELTQLAQLMAAFPAFKFQIAAHTAGVGDPILNLTLSHHRATSIVEALEKMGVAKSRMKALGYGDELPIADHTMPEGREANQRVELTFVK